MSYASDTKSLKHLQAEARAWCAWNFPTSGAMEQLVGVGEELGELAEAINNGHADHLRDALGDIAIFSVNFANQMAFDIETVLAEYEPRGTALPVSFVTLVSLTGQFLHAGLKAKQQIRDISEEKLYQAFRNFWDALEKYAARNDLHFYDVLFQTWGEVRKRDWRTKTS